MTSIKLIVDYQPEINLRATLHRKYNFKAWLQSLNCFCPRRPRYTVVGKKLLRIGVFFLVCYATEMTVSLSLQQV